LPAAGALIRDADLKAVAGAPMCEQQIGQMGG
jgi:hypothetical protein